MPRKKKTDQLWPLTSRQRRFLSHAYFCLRERGRLPTFTESCNACAIDSNEFSSILTQLTRKGWLHRHHTGWWPVGVDRAMSFRYPATMFLTNTASQIQLDAIDQAQGRPESIDRLANLAKVAQSLGLHHDDALTIQWAVDRLNDLGTAVRVLKAAARGGQGKQEKVWVPYHLLLEMVEAIPEPCLTAVNFAIHFDEPRHGG